jgi:hypothetical protein
MVLADQCDGYITKVRTKATTLLELTDELLGLGLEWNSLFGGASALLPEHFIQGNEGLEKADIENAKIVFDALQTFLNADQNRVNLEKIRNS